MKTLVATSARINKSYNFYTVRNFASMKRQQQLKKPAGVHVPCDVASLTRSAVGGEQIYDCSTNSKA